METETSTPTCSYCGEEVRHAAQKCPKCREWLQWTVPRSLEILGKLVVLASFCILAWQTAESRRLQQIAAEGEVVGRYIALDKVMLENPEFLKVFVPTDEYEETVKLLGTPDGRAHLREGQFVAYALDIFEREYLLRDQHGLYAKGTEEGLERFITNPQVRKWWSDEKLNEWYSKEFRDYVDGRMQRR